MHLSLSGMAGALLRIPRGAQSFFFDKPAVLRRAIHTSVWWDLNSCKVPKRCDISSITGNISDALAKLSYDSPVSFTAYGPSSRFFEPEYKKALSDAGIKLVDVPNGEVKNFSTRQMLFDIMFWTRDHPAPANCLIISGDKDLSFVLHQLSLQNYNVLLAKPRKVKSLVDAAAKGGMEAAAKTLWRWKSLMAGGPPEWINEQSF